MAGYGEGCSPRRQRPRSRPCPLGDDLERLHRSWPHRYSRLDSRAQFRRFSLVRRRSSVTSPIGSLSVTSPRCTTILRRRIKVFSRGVPRFGSSSTGLTTSRRSLCRPSSPRWLLPTRRSSTKSRSAHVAAASSSLVLSVGIHSVHILPLLRQHLSTLLLLSLSFLIRSLIFSQTSSKPHVHSPPSRSSFAHSLPTLSPSPLPGPILLQTLLLHSHRPSTLASPAPAPGSNSPPCYHRFFARNRS